ncbi:phosphate regulon sensor histidine kinase PhoR [Leucothrix sargassi]|nr:phosphate regulon sensor histidine kinase PhoR [Leucothrix sargassi]
MTWRAFLSNVLAKELKLILAILFACLLLYTTGLPFLLLLLVGLLGFTVFHLYQAKLLVEWLSSKQKNGPPDELFGIWQMFAGIVHQKNKVQQQKDIRSRALIGQFRKASLALPDGIIILDELSRIEWCNSKAEKLLGLRKKQDIGSHVTNLVRDPSFIRFYQEKVLDESLRLDSPLDKKIKLDLRLIQYADKYLLIIQDFSKLHHMEKVRQDFVANVSHELRTPLSVIVGYIETLDDDDQPELAAYAPIFHQMKQQSDRMTRLVEDLLTLSNLENESSNINHNNEVPVPDMLQGISDDAIILSGSKNHKIDLVMESKSWLLGNTRELHGVFSNLIANAVHYTPENGTITIHWYETDESAIMEVVDTGIGIEEKHIERLTERFYRADKGRSRAEGGTGLGLAIVKHALQRHDATLKISSVIGEGSTFRCIFPLERVIDVPFTNDD